MDHGLTLGTIKGLENIAEATVFFENDKGELSNTITNILDRSSANNDDIASRPTFLISEILLWLNLQNSTWQVFPPS